MWHNHVDLLEYFTLILVSKDSFTSDTISVPLWSSSKYSFFVQWYFFLFVVQISVHLLLCCIPIFLSYLRMAFMHFLYSLLTLVFPFKHLLLMRCSISSKHLFILFSEALYLILLLSSLHSLLVLRSHLMNFLFKCVVSFALLCVAVFCRYFLFDSKLQEHSSLLAFNTEFLWFFSTGMLYLQFLVL